jgi:branched-chain amino acid transport system ATP-binding protein
MAMLEIEGLYKRFGGLAALNNLELAVDSGEIRGVIGPNGAGKTTLFNVVSGLHRPTSGEIRFNGERISGLSAHRIAALGVVRTFQRVALFQDFNVLKNVSIARHLHAEESVLGAILGTARAVERESQERALEILDFIGLSHVKDEMAVNLPYGYQRALGVAIALAAEPKLLMLDEPVAGMNAAETEHMIDLIRRLRDERGVTVVLVEHDMRTVMSLCEKITVLNFGEKLAEGSPQQIRGDASVIEAYLGSENLLA